MITVLSIVAYVAALTIAIGVLLALVTGRSRTLPVTAAWILCAACLFFGPPLASAVSPDWSPFSILGLNAPFLVVAVWAGVVGVKSGRRSHT